MSCASVALDWNHLHLMLHIHGRAGNLNLQFTKFTLWHFLSLIKLAAGVASIKLVVCLCVFVAHYHNEIIMLYNRNRAQE